MKNKVSILFFLVLALVSSYLIYNLNVSYKEYTDKFYYLDNFIYVKIYTNDSDASKYLEEVKKIYKKYSELINLENGFPGSKNAYYICNNKEYSDYLKLDSKLYDLINTSITYMSDTDFDIRYGSLMLEMLSSLEKGVVPEFRDIKLNDIILSNDSILNNHNCFDFSNIIHGYTNNLVKKYLESVGVNRFIIDNGGVVTLGKYYLENGKYTVGLENPNIENDVFLTITMNNKTVSSKGSIGSSYFINDKRYSKFIDFKNKKLENNVLSVSVISSDPIKAEVYSSILINMNVEEALDLVNKTDDMEAIFYISNTEQILSDGFNTYIK